MNAAPTTRRKNVAKQIALVLLVLFFGSVVINVPSMAKADNQITTKTPSEDSSDEVKATLTLAPSKPVAFGFWKNIAGNKARMIQVGIVAMALGIMLLMWGNGRK